MTPNDELAGWIAEGKKLCQTGKFAEARELFGKAIHFVEATSGSEAPELVNPLMGLASSVDERRPCEHADCPRVLEIQKRALIIAETVFGRNHARTAMVLAALGLTLWKLKQLEDAHDSIARALQIVEQHTGESRRTSELLETLASLLLEMKRPADALPLFQRNLRIEEKNGVDTAGIMSASWMLGRCLLNLERGTEAVRHLEHALAIRIARRPPEFKEEDFVSKEIRKWIAEAHAKP